MIYAYLETVGVLVTSPTTSVRVEKESVLVFFSNVVVEILSKCKLSVKLQCRQLALDQ